MQKKRGLFGGSFDPVHLAHLNIAKAAYIHFGLDQVIFIPNYQSPFKETIPLSFTHRLEMLRLATMSFPFFCVSTIEIKEKEPQFTYDTLLKLKALYPQDTLYFIAGSDILDSFLSWKESRALLQSVSFIIAPREENMDLKEHYLIKKYPHSFLLLPPPIYKISSTLIKKEILSEQNLALLPTKVAEYIKQHHLYV